jgi:hypothetical protein
MENIIGKTLNLDLGAQAPVMMLVKEITDTKVIVEYLRSWSGRVEEFNIESFEKLSGLKLRD